MQGAHYLSDVMFGMLIGAVLEACSIAIIIPVIKPILATVALFTAVAQWNAFQDTVLLVNDKKLYTLQFILYEKISQASSAATAAYFDTSSSRFFPYVPENSNFLFPSE